MWNFKHERQARKNGGLMTDDEVEKAKEFGAKYLNNHNINPRGVTSHLIPSKFYSNQKEQDRYARACAEA